VQRPKICFVGDFNAGATNTFGGLLEDFCMENDLIISDYALLPQDTFTSGAQPGGAFSHPPKFSKHCIAI